MLFILHGDMWGTGGHGLYYIEGKKMLVMVRLAVSNIT